MLVFRFDLTAEFGKARELYFLLSGGPFDLRIGQRGIYFYQEMGAAAAPSDGDGREQNRLLENPDETLPLNPVIFFHSA